MISGLETVLSICGDERRAFIFSEIIGDNLLSVRNLTEKIKEEFPNVNRLFLGKGNIRNYCSGSFSSLGLVEEGSIIQSHPIRGEEWVKAWKLAERPDYDLLKSYVYFVLEKMDELNLSFVQTFGHLSGPKNAPANRVKILKELYNADNKMQTIDQLAGSVRIAEQRVDSLCENLIKAELISIDDIPSRYQVGTRLRYRLVKKTDVLPNDGHVGDECIRDVYHTMLKLSTTSQHYTAEDVFKEIGNYNLDLVSRAFVALRKNQILDARGKYKDVPVKLTDKGVQVVEKVLNPLIELVNSGKIYTSTKDVSELWERAINRYNKK